jgi:glycosyltransferase involved in cell wall biosynthesis
MEALSAGRFVIASKPAGEELIENMNTGLVVEAANINQLKEAVEYSLGHYNEIAEMAKAARNYALSHFDIEQNVLAMEKIYTSL